MNKIKPWLKTCDLSLETRYSFFIYYCSCGNVSEKSLVAEPWYNSLLSKILNETGIFFCKYFKRERKKNKITLNIKKNCGVHSVFRLVSARGLTRVL